MLPPRVVSYLPSAIVTSLSVSDAPPATSKTRLASLPLIVNLFARARRYSGSWRSAAADCELDGMDVLGKLNGVAAVSAEDGGPQRPCCQAVRTRRDEDGGTAKGQAVLKALQPEPPAGRIAPGRTASVTGPPAVLVRNVSRDLLNMTNSFF